MMHCNHGAVPLRNSRGKIAMSLAKTLLLSLAALSVETSGPFATALENALGRYNQGTIITDKLATQSCVSVDSSKYFNCVGTDSDTTAYTTWLDEIGVGYTNSMYYSAELVTDTTDPEKGIAVFWTIEGDTIRMAMVARAEGWVGFGLSESGAMVGSDVILYDAERDMIEDAHVLTAYERPTEDELQAVTPINSVREGGFIIAEFSRPIDTEDGQDRAFIDDSDITKAPTRFIAAWGDGSIAWHGPVDRVQGQARFYGERAGPDVFAFQEYMTNDLNARAVNLKYGDFGTAWGQAGEVPIYADATRVRCFEMNDLVAAGFPANDNGLIPAHIVGIERINDLTADNYIRRVNLFKATAPGGVVCRNTGISVGGDIDLLLTPTTRDLVRGDIIYAWSQGSESVAFPNNAGLLVGEKPMGLIMEVSYHNPDGTPRIIDQSGFKLWITEDLRENNIGVARFGTITGGSNTFFKNYPNFQPIDLFDGIQEHVFTCPTNCTQNRLPVDGVTVFREQLTMNTSPKALRMSTSVNRDGTVVREGLVDIYASAQNGFYTTSKDLPYNVMPGDSVETKCYYDGSAGGETNIIGNTGGNEIYLGSFPSTETRESDEQCMSILYYYPANDTDIGLVCDVTVGRGSELPPGNEDGRQEEQGCVAVHSGESISVSLESLTVFGESSGNDNVTNLNMPEPSSGSVQLFQRRLQWTFLAAFPFVGLFAL